MIPRKTKEPVCKVCGLKMLGRVPLHLEVICFLCDNPNKDEQDNDTNWKDKK